MDHYKIEDEGFLVKELGAWDVHMHVKIKEVILMCDRLIVPVKILKQCIMTMYCTFIYDVRAQSGKEGEWEEDVFLEILKEVQCIFGHHKNGRVVSLKILKRGEGYFGHPKKPTHSWLGTHTRIVVIIVKIIE